MRIAMWSGPRNLSTALMYSFAARGDCAVWDEPFYAAYLAASGLAHPMRDEILAAGEVDATKVAAACVGPIPDGRPVFYQKHMAHHMVPGFARDWVLQCVNVFVIRHPARVIASYAAKREAPIFDDLGFRQQLEIFEMAEGLTGKRPVVVDTHDLRQNPKGILEALCLAINLGFRPQMLSWPKGGHASDGAWAPHWYGSVHQSTGFQDPEGPLPKVSGENAAILEQAMPIYQQMAKNRLGVCAP